MVGYGGKPIARETESNLSKHGKSETENIQEVPNEKSLFASGNEYNSEKQEHRRYTGNANHKGNSFEKSTLVIYKIPPHLNTISCLNDHFSKFGTVVNVLTRYENNPESALVKFSNNFEATSAIRSTEAVLNNRFIKVCWLNKANNDSSVKANNVPSNFKNVRGKFIPNHWANKKPFISNTNLGEGNESGTNDQSVAEVAPARNPFKRPFNAEENNATNYLPYQPSVKKPFNPPAPSIHKQNIQNRIKQNKLNKQLQEAQQNLKDAFANQTLMLNKMKTAEKAKEKNIFLNLLNQANERIKELQTSIESIRAELTTLDPYKLVKKDVVPNDSTTKDTSETTETEVTDSNMEQANSPTSNDIQSLDDDEKEIEEEKRILKFHWIIFCLFSLHQ